MFRRLIPTLIACAAIFGDSVCWAGAPGSTNEAPLLSATETATNQSSVDSAALMRSVLILQEELKNTQREIAQARQDAQEEARRTSDFLADRLSFIEQKQVATMETSNQLTLTIVGIIAGLAVLSVVLSGWVQMRAVSRLGEIARQLDTLPELMAGSFKQLGNGEAAPMRVTPAAQLSSGQVNAGLSRLHDRLDDLAATANGSNGSNSSNGSNGAIAIAAKELPSAQSRAAMEIAKGQTLLNLEKPDQALAAFEQAIEIDPQSIEAWVKKGSALERLQRIDEAIHAYDQAIELDDSTATAYLFKAGVFNRQKRYAEALQCYEKALNVQKSRATGARMPSVA